MLGNKIVRDVWFWIYHIQPDYETLVAYLWMYDEQRVRDALVVLNHRGLIEYEHFVGGEKRAVCTDRGVVQFNIHRFAPWIIGAFTVVWLLFG